MPVPQLKTNLAEATFEQAWAAFCAYASQVPLAYCKPLGAGLVIDLALENAKDHKPALEARLREEISESAEIRRAVECLDLARKQREAIRSRLPIDPNSIRSTDDIELSR